MKITIDKRQLSLVIGRAQNIVEKKNTMPILVNILLEAENSTLKMFATDLEVSLTDELAAEVIQPGKSVVNAKNLYEIVKELNDGPISLEATQNHWLRVTQNKSIFNIVGLAPEDYPVFPDIAPQNYQAIEKTIFKEMIEKTIYSVSTDDARYHLNGVFLEIRSEADSSQYRMVATDGHRLSLVDRIMNTKNPHFDSDRGGVIIPRKGLNEIKKLLDSSDEQHVEIAIEGAQLILRLGSTLMMIRLIEGIYPDYQQLIPDKTSETLIINREGFLHSLKRVSLLSNIKSKGVSISLFPGKMEISSNNPEMGDAKEELDIEYNGKEMRIGFNARYMLDVLNAMSEEKVQVEITDQLSPSLVRPFNDNSYTCIVMPMRF